MNTVGEISVILNGKFAVAKTTTPLILGSEVLVYTEAQLDEANKQKTGLENVVIPKGKLKVILRQSDNQYLLTMIDKNSMEANSENDSLARNLSVFHQSIGGNQVETTQDTAPYGAKLDMSQNIQLDINPLATIGDKIAYTNGESKALNN